MAITYTPAATDALFNAFTGTPFDDPKTYETAVNRRIDSKFFLKPIQDEVLKLIAVALKGGSALPVRNATGSTIVAGPVRITGYDATNSAFNIALSDADSNSPAHFLLLTSLATATSGVAYLSGDYVSALDTTAISIGTEVFLSASGIATVTAPTGADQIVQSIGFTVDQSATGTIRGMIQRPKKIGTSFIQSSAITASQLASDAVTTAKVLDANITTSKILDANVTLAKLANVATATILGRSAAGTGAVSALSALPAMDGSALTGVTSTVADGSITGGAAGAGVKIAAATITADNIAALAVTNAKINDMAASKLTGALPAIDGSALTGIVTTPADGSITLAKMANMATDSFIGRDTAGTGVPEILSAATAKTILAIAAGDVSGLAASATMNTVDASNITSGTLPAARIGAASLDLTTKVTGDLPLANLAQGTARSVLAVTGNATADYAPIQGTADQVLRVNAGGTALEMGTIAAGGIASDAVTTAKILAANVTLAKLEALARPADNLLINGGFSVFQRALTTSMDVNAAYCADRWKCQRENAQLYFTQSSGIGQTGITARHYGDFTKNTTPGRFAVYQTIEGVNTIPLIGRTVTFQAKLMTSSARNYRMAIIEWTGTIDAPTSIFATAMSDADGTDLTLNTSHAKLAVTGVVNCTSANNGGTCAVTTSWQNFAISCVVGASTKNLACVVFSDVETGTATSALSITEAGLYLGDSVREWSPRLVAQELELCQRYYEKSYYTDVAPGTATQNGMCMIMGAQTDTTNYSAMHIGYSTPKRIVATPVMYDSAGATGKCDRLSGAGWTNTTGYGGYAGYPSNRGFSAYSDNATARAGAAFHWTVDAEL